jgi:tetratricopeptide (TPR) repeat protein
VDCSFEVTYLHIWRGDCRRGLDAIERAAPLAVSERPAVQHRLLLIRAVAAAVLGNVESAMDTLRRAHEMETDLPELAAGGFSDMCAARVHYAAANLDKAAEFGLKAKECFRRSGKLWAEAEIFEPLNAALRWGRFAELRVSLQEATCAAERIGHQNALWVYRLMDSEIRMHLGDLAEAERLALETDRFASAISAGWRHLGCVTLADIYWLRGDLDQSICWAQAGLEVEFPNYHCGLLSGILFRALATRNDAAAETALCDAWQYLPVPGQPLTVGSSRCLGFVLEGLALSGRIDEAAALEGAAEYMLSMVPGLVHGVLVLSTIAGIASASARNWRRAEEHHQSAVATADSVGFRASQPVARSWFAEMLLSRNRPGDGARAEQLLTEALKLYDDMGMLRHGRWCLDRLAGLRGSPI